MMSLVHALLLMDVHDDRSCIGNGIMIHAEADVSVWVRVTCPLLIF